MNHSFNLSIYACLKICILYIVSFYTLFYNCVYFFLAFCIWLIKKDKFSVIFKACLKTDIGYIMQFIHLINTFFLACRYINLVHSQYLYFCELDSKILMIVYITKVQSIFCTPQCIIIQTLYIYHNFALYRTQEFSLLPNKVKFSWRMISDIDEPRRS